MVDFADAVKTAVFALNDVLDEGLPLEPLEEQRNTGEKWRQIGLGIMGLADMLIKMGIRYGSQESLDLCAEIGSTMINSALAESAELAEEEGSFPAYDYDKIRKSEFYKFNVSYEIKMMIADKGLRNSQILTIAPTGSLSSMLGISGGIEPIYANYYERKTESLHGKDVYYKVYTPIVKEYMDAHNLTDDSELPDYFVTAQTLDYRERIDMQATWQHYIDASISSTVNVPHEFTVEQVGDLYMRAWEKGLKGITIFRDNCKRVGILSTDTSEADSQEEEAADDTDDEIDISEDINTCNLQSGTVHFSSELPRGTIVKADDNCIGKKRTLHTGCGTLHVEAFFDPDSGELLETYFSKGSTGGCNNFMIGLSRMISLAARGGIVIEDIVDQLQSCGTCPAYAVRKATKKDVSPGSCCPVAIGNAILDMYNEMQEDIFGDVLDTNVKQNEVESKDIPVETETEKEPERDIARCPECGSELAFEGGCNVCKNCGWSRCD